MEFRILGPLEVDAGGRPLPLAGPKQRALLAILLLHPNRVVSSDRLIDELWGDDPPETGNAALQMRISGLRKSLEGKGPRQAPSQVLLTRSPGYLLRVETGQLDAERFESLLTTGRGAVASGDRAAAAQVLRDALALWRGDALADFAYEPFAQAEIARLEELRLSALEERVEADLSLGRHFDLVGEVEALIARHPLRERLRGQLMLALYHSGRQAEALAAYRETRRTLVDELGIEPSPALQRLEAAILRQDPTLEAPVASSSQASEAPPRTGERRKTVTVVVADPVISVGRAELDPEALRRVGERHLEAATKVFERHGGVVERPLGGQLMAVFGVPTLHEDDALRAVRAASELGEALALLSDELERDHGVRVTERIGVATGEVVTGDPASGKPLVVGEAVTLAGRLCQAAAVGEVLLGDTTRRLVGQAIRVEPVVRRGMDSAWRELGLAPVERAMAGRIDAPLVGRGNELAQLRATFERAARERALHLFTVLGSAGIGKTRLAQELVSLVGDSATVLTGRCLPYGEGITFWPLNEMVRQAAPDGAIADLLAGEEGAELVAERVAAAIGLGEVAGSVGETFWAVRRLFEALARTRPLLLVVEDIHWAEQTLLALLEYLAGWTGESPILLLCLARPELLEARPTWGGGKVNATSILLAPLAEGESDALIDGLPGESSLGAPARARVREAAEGNPLFLEQMVAMVAEQGAPSGQLPLPPTIQAVLAARLERLGPGERAVLERAAVMGKEFWPGAVVELLPEEGRAFAARHLDALVRRELLRPGRSHFSGGGTLHFRHVLIQQSAYRSVPKELRAELHEHFAGWLGTRTGETIMEVEEVVGYHLEQAFRNRADLGRVAERELEIARRAAGHLASAGRRAFDRGDMPASVNLLGRAASLLPLADGARLELLPNLAFASFEIGEPDRASALLAEALERARASGDRRTEWRAVVQGAQFAIYTHPGQVDQGRLNRDAEEAIQVLGRLDDDLGLARAWSLLSDVRFTMGEVAGAMDAAERAGGYARSAGSRREEAWNLGAYAYSLVPGPTPVLEGIRRLEQFIREAAGNMVVEANLGGYLANLEAMDGRNDAARERSARSRALTHDQGLRHSTGFHHQLVGRIELLAGDPAAAERDMRAAFETFRETGDEWNQAIVATELLLAVYEQERYEDAFELLAELDDLPADSSPTTQIKRRDVLARLLARRGEIGEAEALAREAVAIAARTDLLNHHGDALMGLAEVLRLDGRPQEAIGALGEALRLYERKGNVVLAGKARALLSELFREERAARGQGRAEPTRGRRAASPPR